MHVREFIQKCEKHLYTILTLSLMQMASINVKNVLIALGAVLGVIGLLGAIYILFMVNGLVIGTTAQVATSGNINVSPAMDTYLSEAEGDYISDAETLQTNVTLALQIMAIVIILVLFGIGALFGRDLFKKKGGSGGVMG